MSTSVAVELPEKGSTADEAVLINAPDLLFYFFFFFFNLFFNVSIPANDTGRAILPTTLPPPAAATPAPKRTPLQQQWQSIPVAGVATEIKVQSANATLSAVPNSAPNN